MGDVSWKDPGRILLISCYELGHQPLGLALPKAFLEKAGYHPATQDMSIEPLDENRVEDARLVAISVPMHTALRIGMQAALRVRAINPRAKICFHGLYAVLNSEFLLEQCADFVLGGECEESLVQLVAGLEAGSRNEIPGKLAPVIVELRRLNFPVPSREGLLPLEDYARLEYGDTKALVGYVEASRGCKHLCAHCPIPPVYQGRFFAVPVEIVMEDIRRLVRAGARHINFGDPDFLNGPRHAMRTVEAMRREFPFLTYDFTAKIEHLRRHREFIPWFASSGCAFVVSAAESLSNSVLSHLKKGHASDDVFAVVSDLRDAGITFRPTWVPFTPWTTMEDYLGILAFVEEEDLIDSVDLVQYALRLLIPPGSLLLSDSELRPHLRELVPDQLSYRWVHPDPRMDQLYEDVTARVERSILEGEDSFLAFFEIKELAWKTAGVCLEGLPRPTVGSQRQRPPRLTEPWFC